VLQLAAERHDVALAYREDAHAAEQVRIVACDVGACSTGSKRTSITLKLTSSDGEMTRESARTRDGARVHSNDRRRAWTRTRPGRGWLALAKRETARREFLDRVISQADRVQRGPLYGRKSARYGTCSELSWSVRLNAIRGVSRWRRPLVVLLAILVAGAGAATAVFVVARSSDPKVVVVTRVVASPRRSSATTRRGGARSSSGHGDAGSWVLAAFGGCCVRLRFA
jgi:hypothetical protein